MLLLINMTPTRWSNRQDGVDWINTLVSIEWLLTQMLVYGIRKMLEKRTKTIVGDCSTPNSRYSWCWIDICILNTFFILSILSSFFAIKLSRPVRLWPIIKEELLTLKYFQRADKNKLQQQGLFTQIFNYWLKSDSWFRLAGGCQELLGPQTALYALLHRNRLHWRWGYTHEGMGMDQPAAGGTWMWAGARPAPGAAARAGRWCVPAPGAGRRQHLPWLQTQSLPAL